MKKYKSFSELMKEMKNPLDNPDFYALIMTFRLRDKKKFSACSRYDLGQNTKADQKELWNFVLKEYFCNVKANKNEKEIMRKIREEKRKFAQSELKGKGLDRILGTHMEIGTMPYNQWFYFTSEQINPSLKGSLSNDDIKHRLYLTIDANSRVKMAEKIVEKCTNQRLPYRFKILFSQKQKNMQSDTMVMYLHSEEQVVQYVNIINEIFEENPDLKKSAHKVSPHLGIIDEYIGYGFEPHRKDKTGNKIRESYSMFVESIVCSKDMQNCLNNAFIEILTKIPASPEQIKSKERIINSIKEKINGKEVKITDEEWKRIENVISFYFKKFSQSKKKEKIKRQFHEGLYKEYPQLLESQNMYSLPKIDKNGLNIDGIPNIKGLRPKIAEARERVDQDLKGRKLEKYK